MSNYMLSNHEEDPSVGFENLARAAFDNCARYNDPFGIADQSIASYEGPENNEMTDDYRRALVLVLAKLVIRYPENEELKNLEKRVWTAKTQDEVNGIVQSATEVYLSL